MTYRIRRFYRVCLAPATWFHLLMGCLLIVSGLITLVACCLHWSTGAAMFALAYMAAGAFLMWRWLDRRWRDRPRRAALQRVHVAFDRCFASLPVHSDDTEQLRRTQTGHDALYLSVTHGLREVFVLAHTDLENCWLHPDHADTIPVRVVILTGKLATSTFYPAKVEWETEGADRHFHWSASYQFIYPASRHLQNCILADAAQLNVAELAELRDLLTASTASSDQTA
jgi:hypothetical protein